MWCVSRGVRESGDIYVFVRSTLPDFVAGHERCRWRCLFSLLGIGKREGGSAKQCVGGGIQAFPLLRVRPCGRASDSREKLTTEPARANPPASNRAIWQPFSGSIWNSRATRAAPVVCPVSRLLPAYRWRFRFARAVRRRSGCCCWEIGTGRIRGRRAGVARRCRRRGVARQKSQQNHARRHDKQSYAAHGSWRGSVRPASRRSEPRP